MHTVVFGWFGLSAVWFLPLIGRLIRAALPGGAGLRGPGTIRLWLGFLCVLLASCALEASIVTTGDALGHALVAGLARLSGHVGAVLIPLAALLVSLPWLIGFQWPQFLAWADGAFGLGFGMAGRFARRNDSRDGSRDSSRDIQRESRSERRERRRERAEGRRDERARRSSDDDAPLPTLSSVNPMAPKSGGRYARPTVWTPPAPRRGAGAGSAAPSGLAAVGEDAAAGGYPVRGIDGRRMAERVPSPAMPPAAKPKTGRRSPLDSLRRYQRPTPWTPSEPTASTEWLKQGAPGAASGTQPSPAQRVDDASRAPSDAARDAAARANPGEANIGASTGMRAAMVTVGAAGLAAAGRGMAAGAGAGAGAGAPGAMNASAANPRVTGSVAGAQSRTGAANAPRPAATTPPAPVQRAATPGGWRAPPQPTSAGTRTTSETSNALDASSAPGSVQDTLRSIEENAARWTQIAGASLARQSAMDAAKSADGSMSLPTGADESAVVRVTSETSAPAQVETQKAGENSQPHVPTQSDTTRVRDEADAFKPAQSTEDSNGKPQIDASNHAATLSASASVAAAATQPATPATDTTAAPPAPWADTPVQHAESATEKSATSSHADPASDAREAHRPAPPTLHAVSNVTPTVAASVSSEPESFAASNVVRFPGVAIAGTPAHVTRVTSPSATSMHSHPTHGAVALNADESFDAAIDNPADADQREDEAEQWAATPAIDTQDIAGNAQGNTAPATATTEATTATAAATTATPATGTEPAQLAQPEPRREPQPEPQQEPQQPLARAPLRGYAAASFEFHAPTASSVELPSLDLLERASSDVEPVSDERLTETGQLIEQRLQEFKVPVTVVGASAGPVITRFEVEPALGVRGSQIVGLMKDLSRGLGLTSIRVVETIPGKTCMGLELPNAKRQMIRLSEILEANAYQHSSSQLTIALGKDIIGHPIVTDLAKAPHMLVAGTTGSGKSVAINAMIVSLLYKATPEDVRMIMIDPKMLELSVYEGIPHLLAPVVTDMKLAANALNWCVGEMEKRYRLMSAVGVRNLAGFNQKIRDAEAKEKKIGNPFSLTPDAPEPLATLPMIVVVIDELADLMMVAGKKIEELIARLAQKARAAGIHLILATQRPSVDVITGLIKANIPTRIAFQVSSKIDSRTILDQMGAESLLGQGDMLFLPPGTGYPQRVHGAFVTDEEVHRIVEHLKQFGEPEYIEGILDGPASEGASQDLFGDAPDAEADPLYDEAVAFVVRTRRASISSVQRQLRIGYNRAARLVEQMEAAGLVSSMGINGSREVLAPGSAE